MLRDLIIIFFISMIPVSELRVSIPLAIANGIDPLPAMLISMFGNMIPIPFIIIFIRSIFQWMRRISPKINDLVTRIEDKAWMKAEKVRKAERWGLMAFVAIPLPGTGGWTGALIAALLDIRLKYALPSIFAGICIAAVIVTLISVGIISG